MREDVLGGWEAAGFMHDRCILVHATGTHWGYLHNSALTSKVCNALKYINEGAVEEDLSGMRLTESCG